MGIFSTSICLRTDRFHKIYCSKNFGITDNVSVLTAPFRIQNEEMHPFGSKLCMEYSLYVRKYKLK